MTKRLQQIHYQTSQKEQLFEAFTKYLQNLGLVERSFKTKRILPVRKLELTVRSLNLQRLP